MAAIRTKPEHGGLEPASYRERLVVRQDCQEQHTCTFFSRRWLAFLDYCRTHEVSQTVAIERAVRLLQLDDAEGGKLLASINSQLP